MIDIKRQPFMTNKILFRDTDLVFTNAFALLSVKDAKNLKKLSTQELSTANPAIDLQ